MGTCARCWLPPSSRRKQTSRPSGQNRGEATLRSSVGVSGARRPARGRGRRRRGWCRTRCLSDRRRARRRGSCHRAPRGEPSSRRCRRRARRGSARCRCASTTKMSVLSLASGSAVRLLTNAIRVPSGDHAGALSSYGPRVSCTVVLRATSNTCRWSRIVAQVAVAVPLELQAADHDRAWASASSPAAGLSSARARPGPRRQQRGRAASRRATTRGRRRRALKLGQTRRLAAARGRGARPASSSSSRAERNAR